METTEFDGENSQLSAASTSPLSGPGHLQAKTSLRMRYEAQVEVIKQQIGPIELIKARLGLSSRGLAQLLLVDPSAVTRWMKNPQSIPPMTYRALQWYLALSDKLPGLSPQVFIGRDHKIDELQMQQDLQALRCEIQNEKVRLRKWILIAFFGQVLFALLIFFMTSRL